MITALGEAKPRVMSASIESDERVPFGKDRGGVDAHPELEHAQADLAAFHYALSHDFRSPLCSMNAMARIVLEDHAANLPPDVRTFLTHIASTAEKLSVRAEALLRFSRMSRQPLTYHPVNVAVIAREVIADLRNRDSARSVDVLIEELPNAFGDLALIRQVFIILLCNAFKFTRRTEQARIVIKGRADGALNEYTISDNGAGFDMKYAGKLFELFQRMHSENEFEGVGVGLAIAKRIVERHGGGMWAQATKGQGATFHFSLPAI